MAIPERTVAAMLAIVREAALADETPAAIVDGFHDVLRLDYATYDEIGPGGAVTLAQPSSPSAVEAFRHYAHEHPSLADYAATGRLTTRRLSDLTTHRRLRRLGLWADVFRPLGIRFQLTLALHTSGPVLIGLGLCRTGRDFTDEELAVAELLRVELGRIVAARREPAPEALLEIGLTPREAEVLALVARGLTSPTIASVLGISERTVEKHLEHVYEKLGVSGRRAAVAVALGHNGTGGVPERPNGAVLKTVEP